MASKPKLSAKDKDELVAFRNDLSEKISESLPTNTNIKKGLVDPRRELNTQQGACIKVNQELARAMGIETNSRGQVSRSDATRMWKIASKYLGEESYSEALRRD